jgi:hypothetical protein
VPQYQVKSSRLVAPLYTLAFLSVAFVFVFGLQPGRESSAFQATVTLVRGPYLHQVGATGAVVVWATRETGAASVQYRAGTSGTFQSAPATTVLRSSSVTGIPTFYQHEATLTGLAASTTYQYDLRLGSTDATPGVIDQFRTAPADGTGTIRFVAFGDSGTGSSTQGQVATRLEAETFDFAIHTGDIAYSHGTYAQFESFFFPYYRDWLRHAAIFPSIGNHEDRTGSAGPYRALFALPRDGASATYPNNAERFYSFDYGPAHFIALDTEAAFLDPARRKEQVAWLTNDLQQSQDSPWRIVFFHRPPYNSGIEHGSDLTIRQTFGPLFEQYNVQLVLNGHEHHFERSVPWRESTDTTRQAVTYLVTGGAGAPLYGTGRSAWTAFSRSANHYTRATLSTADLVIEAVTTSGTVFDRFTLNRAMQDGDVSAPQVSIDSPSAGAILSGVETIDVTATDDRRVEKVDLWVDGQLRSIDLAAPYSFTLDTSTLSNGSHTLQARAYDIAGKRTIASRTVTVSNGAAAGDIVFYAADAPVRAGSWRVVTDSTAAGGRRLEQPEAGAATIDPPLANPTHYVEIPVTVEADRNYRVWMRIKAAGNSGYSDSIWLQTSGTVDTSGASVFRIGSTSATRINLQDCSGCSVSGWGWQDNGFGTNVLGPVLRFATGGAQTLRIQAREDGISIDQVVLSPSTYLNSSPGALKNDTTILPR